MQDNEFWDSYRFEELERVLLESQGVLRLSDSELKDPNKVGSAIGLFVKESKRTLYYGLSSIFALVLIHYLFLRFATGDNILFFGFLGILGLTGFLIPIWIGTLIIKNRKPLRVLSKDWRYKLVIGTAISLVIPIIPVYVLGSEYVRTLSYQIGTCFQLTGADDKYYYVTNISCYSPKALDKIVLKVDSDQICESKNLSSFATSVGLYCLEQIREATPEELEIIGDREISDENSL
jgi:hypothetical protein